MTFCGYHPLMSVGLAKFGEGVALSTLSKARAAGRTVPEHVQVELEQLEVLLRHLGEAVADAADVESRVRAASLKGLADVCHSAFIGAQDIRNESDFIAHFERHFALCGQLVKSLEDAFEACPDGTSLEKRTEAGVQASLEVLVGVP
jgi:hypothetical protein